MAGNSFVPKMLGVAVLIPGEIRHSVKLLTCTSSLFPRTQHLSYTPLVKSQSSKEEGEVWD